MEPHLRAEVQMALSGFGTQRQGIRYLPISLGTRDIWVALILKDDSTLVSVAGDGIITHWNMKTSEHTTLQTKNTVERTLFTDWMEAFVFSPDGTQIAGTGLDLNSPNPTPWYDNILRLIDVSTGRELRTFPDVGAEMTFSPTEKS